MKKILFPFACMMLIAMSLSAAEWPVQQVTKVVSLRFPVAPHISTTPDQVNFLYPTDSCSYLAQVKHYVEDGKVHDSITLAAFYVGMVRGMMRGAKGTLVRRDSIEIAGLKALEVEYVRQDQLSLPVTVCSRALLINGELVVYTFSAPSNRYDHMASLRSRFLNSVSFDQDSTLFQYHAAAYTNSLSEDTDASVAGSDSTNQMTPLPVSFVNSNAGKVVRMFGLLILLCAVIYFFATLSRRKG